MLLGNSPVTHVYIFQHSTPHRLIVDIFLPSVPFCGLLQHFEELALHILILWESQKQDVRLFYKFPRNVFLISYSIDDSP